MNQAASATSQVIIKVPQGVPTAASSSGGAPGGGGGGAGGGGASNQENVVAAAAAAASIVKTTHAPSGQQLVVTQSKGTTILQPTQGHSGQQFIITTVSGNTTMGGGGASGGAANPSGDHVGGGQSAVYPTIQYVDGTAGAAAEQSIYTNGQPQQAATMQYEYPASNIYTPVSGYQYHSGNQAGITQLGIQGLPALQGQMVHQPAGHTYLIHGGAMDGEGHPLTHTTRASPATVQWLLDNYETADGVSLPRSTLYNHYMRHCQEQKLDPMNPASFGKLIRSVFLGLRTRRLGTRGNSKYHYYGIRIKNNSPLNQLVPDDTAVAMRQPTTPAKRLVRPNLGAAGEGADGVAKTEPGSGGGGGGEGQGGGGSGTNAHQQFLGAGRVQDIVPCLEMEFDETELPDGVTEEDTLAFENMYKEHCESIADVVVNLQFAAIERLWEVFWNADTPADQTSSTKLARKLPKETLHAMARWEPIQTFVRQTDCAFYQALVEVLIPDVLRPIPGTLTQAIRNFAKGLEGWLKAAMADVPEEMVKVKVMAVSAFSQTLRRYTSLNHLAQAARAVLQNSPQIEQMLTDLNKVDFLNIQEQASWVCQCEEGLVSRLEADFKKTLQEQRELEDWAGWLENVVTQALKPHKEDPETYPKAARQFLLKWSFYSSMIIRDLTLRSAASFGSFHLIRLLFDEYMFYLIEHRVANATKETPIAIMGEFKQMDDMNSAGLFSDFFEAKPGSDPNLPDASPAMTNSAGPGGRPGGGTPGPASATHISAQASTAMNVLVTAQPTLTTPTVSAVATSAATAGVGGANAVGAPGPGPAQSAPVAAGPLATTSTKTIVVMPSGSVPSTGSTPAVALAAGVNTGVALAPAGTVMAANSVASASDLPSQAKRLKTS